MQSSNTISAGRARLAFTLTEVLLVIGLLLVLLTLTVLSYANWFRGESLAEGAGRVETVLLMARAEACNRGLRMRLEFDKDGLMSVSWEPQPLTAPGQFAPFTNGSWARNLPNDLVRAVRCDLVGSSAFRQLEWERKEEDEATPFKIVTFLPDGTCDSAVLEFREVARDERHAAVEIDGQTGTVTTRLISKADLEEYHRQLAERLGVDQ